MWLHHLSQALTIDRTSTDCKALAHRWSLVLKWAAKHRIQLKWADLLWSGAGGESHPLEMNVGKGGHLQ